MDKNFKKVAIFLLKTYIQQTIPYNYFLKGLFN